MSGSHASLLRLKAVASGIVLIAVVLLGVTVLTTGAGAGALPDLELEKADSPDPVQVDALLTYTITVDEIGGNPTTGVTVTDTLPKKVKFTSAEASQGTCDRQGRKVTCELGAVAGNGSATVTIRVRPQKAGQISNTATVELNEVDFNNANNTDTETTKVTEGPSCGGKPATIVGTAGDDVITGTEQRDVISALGGNDQVNSLGGKDVICGKSGKDKLKGKADGDLIKGGGGRDTGKGGGGDDEIKGGPKRDRLRGGSGDDLLAGGGGNDSCRGGSGTDTLKSC
jgi:uncharacterized repeat protein (TIGR01451 family)